MLRRSLQSLLTIVPILLLLSSGQAAATFLPAPIDSDCLFEVLDGDDGYALRLDGLDGNPNNSFAFSAERGGAELTILYREDYGDIRIQGTVYGGQILTQLADSDSASREDLAPGDPIVNPGLFSIDFLYEKVSVIDDQLVGSAGWGNGKIIALDDASPFSEGDFAFLEDFGRSAIIIELMRNGMITGEGEIDSDSFSGRSGDQAWNFKVGDKIDPVPEPGTALLIGTGLALLGSRSRNRR